MKPTPPKMQKQILILSFLFLASPFASADNAHQRAASAKPKLSPAQKAQVNKIVEQFEKSCLSGPPVPPNATKTIKMMMSWGTDPRICSCTAARLREAFTPEFFLFSNEQADLFLQHFAENEGAECGVPIMKAHINESCEQFLGGALDEMGPERKEKRLNELGYKDLDTMVKESCECIRSEIKGITPRQWVTSTMTHYQEYLKRKQSGTATGEGPTTPMDAAMNVCFKIRNPNAEK